MKFWNTLLLCLYSSAVFGEPPREVPIDLLDLFTMNKKIPIVNFYLNDSYPQTQPKLYSKDLIDSHIEMITQKRVHYYEETDTWLYQALEKYPIYGKEVGIIGSAMPWYESIVLAYGGHPTTIEYNKIDTDDDRITILTVDEYNSNPKKFDVLLSISSIEHDGLGRYGDPINPNGDLEFMAMAKEKLLKANGHMILAMPLGRDCLVWNAHRIYGPLRLPQLLQGWHIVDTFGFSVAGFFRALGDYGYQPIFYLAPKNNPPRS